MRCCVGLAGRGGEGGGWEEGDCGGLDDGVDGEGAAYLALAEGAVAGLDDERGEVDLVADVAAGTAALHGEEVFSVCVVRHGY